MISYDKHSWRSHLFDVEGSMVYEIMFRVAASMLWSACVMACHGFGYKIQMSPTVHTLVGVALGLLLVFRTNSSYDRYWEGRKVWGAILNDSRNMARSARGYVFREAPDVAHRLGLWTIAFAYATKNSLRGTTGLGVSSDLLDPSDVERVLQTPHPPTAIATQLTYCLIEARGQGIISDFVMIEIDKNIHDLIDCVGACERIRKTPLPFVYVVHLRRALILYCFSLPLALVQFYGWWTILVTLVVSYLFFGIEEIGVEIEDPFGDDANDLPLEVFCQTVARDVTSVLEIDLTQVTPAA